MTSVSEWMGIDDLFLKFRFTDRGGLRVYNVHIGGPEGLVLGEVRLGSDDENFIVEWKGAEGESGEHAC